MLRVNLSQLTLGKWQGTPWTGHQGNVEHVEKQVLPPTDSWESSVNLRTMFSVMSDKTHASDSNAEHLACQA